MFGSEEGREREEERESRRPRVVDKRVSARGGSSSSPPPSQTPAGTEPPSEAEPEKVREPIEVPPASPERQPGETPSQEPPSPEPPPQETAATPPPPPPAGAPQAARAEGPPGAERVWTPEQEAEAQRAAEEMAQVPARDWVLNVAVTLANVAGIKLQDGQFEDSQLAIDAFAGMVDKIESQMGDAGPVLRQTLAQLQMAYAQAVSPPPQPPAE
jgi:hypothetical protein